MRIVLDLQGAQTESRYRGIGRYCLSLAQAIARNASEHEVFIALNGSLPESISELRAAFSDVLPPDHVLVWHSPWHRGASDGDSAWRRAVAALLREHFLQSLQADVIHIGSLFEGFHDAAATSIGMLDDKTPVVVTQHDLIPLLYPEHYLAPNPDYRHFYESKLEFLKRARGWVANSAFTAREAEQYLGFGSGAVTAISAACEPSFRKQAVEPAVERSLRQRLSLGRPFVMYTGGADPRKNLHALMRAWARLPQMLRSEYQLLLVGKMPEGDVSALRRAAERAGVAPGELNFTGYVTDADLVDLYNLCELFVFPSLHEGFGLPVLEAMSCGAPVLCSDAASLPEVVGDEGALFSAGCVDDLAEKLRHYLTDREARLQLGERGLARSATFSWDASARAALAEFERIGGLAQASPKDNRFDGADWAEQSAARQTQQELLIEAIASVRIGRTPAESDLIEVANAIAANDSIADQLLRRRTLPAVLNWRIEGPFDSSYSLALLNRETARALAARGHRAVLHSTEGPGDFEPDSRYLAQHPDLREMHEAAADLPQEAADVTSRNLYPPRVGDMRCRVNLLHHYAWEESGFPDEWVQEFNDSLQGITCLSSHVRKILLDHGVTVPLTVSGCGVDHWLRVESAPGFAVPGRSFRFLHVSSCFPRKGADALLEAFGRAFTSADDVSLVIKTFANPHNQIQQWLAAAREGRADFPDVHLIEADLSDAQLKALYENCHALVAPSRAEGFGLPLAEAMLSGIPVITTGWGGQLDFCNEETAWLVDFDFESARSHFDLYESVWAAPRVDDLARVMREVYSAGADQVERMAAAARTLLERQCQWDQVVARLEDAARQWSTAIRPALPRIGWITTWNEPCGIASYSAHLIDNLDGEVTVLGSEASVSTHVDGPEVVRCWRREGSDFQGVEAAIASQGIDTLVVQFNYGFFNLDAFAAFLHRCIDAGITVVVTLHATTDPAHAPHKKLSVVAAALKRCSRVLVHSVADLNRLKQLGLIENVALFPHGIVDYEAPPRLARRRQLVASYGFFLPHKGLLELIDAVAALRRQGCELELRMVNAEYPVIESASHIARARERIALHSLEQHIELRTEYLPDEESLRLLAEADLIVFPYQDTGESSSAAVRTGLAAGAPVAVTPIPIFDDVGNAVFRLPGQEPAGLAEGIGRLLAVLAQNADESRLKQADADRWREAHRYSLLGRRLGDMLYALRQDASQPQ